MVKRRFRWGFFHSAALYALIFLVAAFFGLRYLWDFADAYEQARPYHAIDGYMAQLTPEYICERSADLIATIDHHIQSEDACRTVITEAVSGGVTYAKKTSECTDEKMVYILRTGNQVIGRVELIPEGEAQMGYTPWAVSSDSFDFSYLLTDTVSTMVPEEFPVYVNGALLDNSYITESQIPYSSLEDFYETYSLPSIVRYTAGPCLGDISLSVTDLAGNPVTIDAQTDLNVYLDNCTEDALSKLETFMTRFVKRYVRFSNSSPKSSNTNYSILMQDVLKGSPLAKRCSGALAGMAYSVSQRYEIQSTQINWCTDIGDGRYLCDVTYVVDIQSKSEIITNTFTMKIVVVRDGDDLKAETLRNY